MNRIAAFEESLQDSFFIKLSEAKLQRLGSLLTKFEQGVPMFAHRAKERIPYLQKNLAEMIFEHGVLTEKLDGALANVYIRNDQESGVASHRISKRTKGPIDYTGKLPGIEATTLPKELKTKEMDLKGEFVVFNNKGKVLPHQEISGFLNSKDETAEKTMKEKKLHPRIALFDIWDDDRSYDKKYKDLKLIADENPKVFFVPEMASTKKQKEKMINKIKTGKNLKTTEGVIWQGLKGAQKIKFRNFATVYINSFFDTISGGKYEGIAVGGINYSITPNGPVIGKVGTGFSDTLRKDMYKNPEKYIGRRIMIEHQGQYEDTKAFRTPSFKKVL